MRAGTWIKSIAGGAVLMIGGPYLVEYVTPTEEELFKKYNPELQKRSLETRDARLKEHNEFMDKLRQYSKSDKPVWTVWKEAEAEDRQRRAQADAEDQGKKKSIAEEIKKQRLEEQS